MFVADVSPPLLVTPRPQSAVWLVLGWWYALTCCLELPSQWNWNALPPAGWQQRTCTASVPGRAVGPTTEAAVTLQRDSQSESQTLNTPSPHTHTHTFPYGVPKMPGAPPKAFVKAAMELWAAILGLFYIRIESTAKIILTDFLVGGFADICLFDSSGESGLAQIIHWFKCTPFSSHWTSCLYVHPPCSTFGPVA